MLFMSIYAFAQQSVIQGVIYEEDGVTPMTGATVMQKDNVKSAVMTDINGNYKINVSGKKPVIVVSFIGYETKNVSVDNKTTVNVVMNPTSVQLNDVVVTALGLTREQKSLGYAVTKIDNSQLTGTVSGNWLNAMNGKVAGMTMDTAGSGPMSSMRVVLRGDQSLNYGSNEALFVVDGVPISSGGTASSSNTTYSNQDAPVDFGNDGVDINPEDVESVTVLKGPSATALYGSRAANGAIVITTKSGRKSKGVGVTLNSSITWERAGYWPDFQSTYGSGDKLGAYPFAFWLLTSDQAYDGKAVTTREYSRYAFGEKYDANVLRYQYNSKNWETGTFTPTPWVYQDDWYTGLFQTGVTYNNSVTISSNNGNGMDTRLSVTDTRNDWILPNTGYSRQTVSLAVNGKMNKWIDLNARVNYLHRASDNVPQSGYSSANPTYGLVYGFTNNSIKNYYDEYFLGRYNTVNYESQGKNGVGLVWPGSEPYNPYRTLYEETSTLEKNRVYGNVGATAKFPVKGLTLAIRMGLDMNDEFRTQKKPYLTNKYMNGFYREQSIRRTEINTDFLLRYVNNDWINKRLSFSASFGGNNMSAKYYTQSITLKQLAQEGVYNVNNAPADVPADPYQYRSRKVVNSLYGFTSLGWDNTYFLDITGRNDWSSTLARGNWSFFYPSVSASILLNEALKLSENYTWIDLTKLRLSWANVGNDTSAYQLASTYSLTSFDGSFTLPGTLANPLLKPENVESWEAGAEIRLWQNRLGIDAAVYNSSTTNQIVSATMDNITGSSSLKINAGEIRNRGIELSAHIVPIRTRDFEWSIDVNWAKNWNKLVSLQDGWDNSQPILADMTSIGGQVLIYSYVGKEMNVIYGKGYQRAPEGSYYLDENGNKVDCSGMKIINESNGYPVLDTYPDREIGKVSPDWTGGFGINFKYKDFSLTSTFTAQVGGHCYSLTNFALSSQGKLKNSLEGRNDGLVVEGVNMVTNPDGTVSYQKNTTITSSIIEYYRDYVYDRKNVEENTFSTSFLKMKEIRLDYSLPKKICDKTKVLKNASFGCYATNLFCITEFPQYDPETGSLNGSDIHSGIETLSFPMTRTYGVNIKLSF